MRVAAAALCGLVLTGVATPQEPAWADAREPDPPATDGTSSGEGNGPQVLRGSAIAPHRPGAMEPTLWRVVAGGDELWLVDPAQGVVVACQLRDTVMVGRKLIRCYEDDLPDLVAD